MPTHPVSNRSASTTPSPSRSTPPHLRAYATRAAVVATTSATAMLLTVLPATGFGPTGPTAAADAAGAPTASIFTPVATAPAVTTAASAGQVRTVDVAPVAVTAAAPEAVPAAARASAVQLALSKIGAPYRWGSAGPSAFDCSGLVTWAFTQAGIDVPRTSRAQSQSGTPVAYADLQPGDLVFSYNPVRHVGIYIGNGQIVHASRAGKPVAVVDIEGRPFHSARRY